MIRTFLIYRLLDNCIDLFFNRIESVFVPISRHDFRVGDQFSKIVFMKKVYELYTENISYYDCEIIGISGDDILVSVKTIEVVMVFNTEDGFLDYKKNDDDGYYVFRLRNKLVYRTDDLTITNTFLSPIDFIVISLKAFESGRAVVC